MSYKLVAQENFTIEQKAFMEKLKSSIQLISQQSNIVLGAKDVHSRHLMATDSYAGLVALPKGRDVADRLDCEMPCEGTASFAESYLKEDGELLRSISLEHKIATLNIHEYGNGTKALVFNKSKIKHHPSSSILGLIYDAYEIDIKNLFMLLPNYAMEFGKACSIECTSSELKVENVKLTEYEHEVCFLLIMNWSFSQIASFMNKYRPTAKSRSADTIYKCKNRICEKLNIPPSDSSGLRDMLVDAGLHKRMPKLFFGRLIGSSFIEKELILPR